MHTFQALKIAFPTGTFLKNGIVQGIKVSSIISFSLFIKYIGVGTIGAPGGWCPPTCMFSDILLLIMYTSY